MQEITKLIPEWVFNTAILVLVPSAAMYYAYKLLNGKA